MATSKSLMLFAVLSLLPVLQAAPPEDDLVKIMKPFFAKDFVNDWQGVEKIPGVRWAPTTSELKNCLPDGGCYARQGVIVVGGKNLVVIASGARTIVTNLFIRNTSAPFGEAAVIAALKATGFSADLARCPVTAGTASTNWYAVKSANTNPGYLSVQTPPNGGAGEGFVLILSEKLPPLQPNQLRLYTEQCSATGADRKPISTVLPHEQLARTLVALLPQAAGPALYDWKTLAGLPAGITWPAGTSAKGNATAWTHGGSADYSGRQFYFSFAGSPTQVKTAQAEEGGLHPRGEDLLGLLRSQSFTVQLVRCGPVYTESTNNWYRVSSSATRPVMLKQSIRVDGNQVQDSYEMRLDASLPARDPRDRDPGVNGCR